MTVDKTKKLGRFVNQYLVLYYDGKELRMENFPDVYFASLWVKRKGGYILKEVEMAEVNDG